MFFQGLCESGCWTACNPFQRCIETSIEGFSTGKITKKSKKYMSNAYFEK